MKAAAIDIGTNSVKLVVGQNGEPRILRENVLITRLGEGLGSTGLINAEAARRTLEGIHGLVTEARGLGASQIRAVATSALREAANRDEFIGSVERNLGIKVEILSGEEEARLARLAVTRDSILGRFADKLVTVDVGGGSTEITTPNDTASIDVGAVRLHERFIRSDPPSEREIEAARTAAAQELERALSPIPGGMLVASGGSAVNLARMAKGIPVPSMGPDISSMGPDLKSGPIEGAGRSLEAHGSVLTREQLARTVERLSRMTMEQRRAIVGLDPERADIILTGAIILSAALNASGNQEMTVSVAGLRHGVLYKMLEENG